ncbi:MAG: hypothetical protein KAT70_02130 [Thermoplasmata archaeon]|nr:hypothetical protein [Thermoplasmata archaeon]
METTIITDREIARDYLLLKLPKIDFDETRLLIDKIEDRISKGKNPKRLLDCMDVCIKTDFLANTRGDLEAYGIINQICNQWGARRANKSRKFKFALEPGSKASLIDQNLGVILKMYEDYKSPDHSNREIRFYVMLFGLTILHEIIMESGDETFASFIEGNINNKERKELVRNYFKIDSIIETERGLRSDSTRLRNTLSHARFKTENEKIFLYHEGESQPEVLEYQQIVDIYNVLMKKWVFSQIIHVIHYYQGGVYVECY